MIGGVPRAEPGGRPRPDLRRYRDDARRLTGADGFDRVDPSDTGRAGESDVGGPGRRARDEHDLAVTVMAAQAPPGLLRQLTRAVTDLLQLPDADRTRTAIAARHGRYPAEVLLTPGGTAAYELIGREFRPRHVVVVHPQFAAPEAALRAAGHAVERVVLPEPFVLDPTLVPTAADLVVLANPTNPTSVSHPRAVVQALLRPGRVVVVDETLADCVPGQPGSVAGYPEPGLVVLRGLPPAWDIARLRIGYLLATPDLVQRLGQWQSHWPVSSTALAAAALCASPDVLARVADWSSELAARRTALLVELAAVPGVRVVADPSAAFVLLHHRGDGGVRMSLRDKGFLVRRGSTYPGLGPAWLRVAVPDPQTSAEFATALRDVLASG